jgi:hypothetical protein
VSGAYAQVVFERELTALANAPQGQRNLALFKTAARLGDLVGAGLLPLQAAASGLFSAANANGLLQDDGQRAVAATIASGLQRGMANPSPMIGGRRYAR